MLLSRSRISRGSENWPTVIESALKAAARRIRWRGAWNSLASNFAAPVVAAAAWIALARFTLLEIPYWPSLLFFALWLVGFGAWVALQQVSISQAARYLDRVLDLDESVATYVELQRQANFARRTRTRATQWSLGNLADEVGATLDQRRGLMPSAFKFRLRARHGIGLALSVAALFAAMFVPSPLDAVRTERALLRQAVANQIAQLSELRADIVQRPDLSDEPRQALLAEIDQLDKQLHAKDLDQSSVLAALSDSQERIKQLAGRTPSEFDALILAAQTVWSTAEDGSPWDPTESEDTSDLGRAADSLNFVSTYLSSFTAVEDEFMAAGLDRAALQAGPGHALVGQDLTEAAGGLRTNDGQVASRALRAASARFRRAKAEYQAALAVENTLAKLEEARQDVSKSTGSNAKKPQVGFRRRDQGQATTAGAAPGGSSAQSGTANGDQSSGTPGRPQDGSFSGTSPRVGSNMPALGGQQGRPGDANNATGQQGSGGSQGDGQGGSQSGASAGGGQSSDPSSQGSLSAPVTGPVGGGGGAISRVQNPEGQGVAQEGQSSAASGSGSEKVYVPVQGTEPGSDSNASGSDAAQGDTSGRSGSSAIGQEEPGDKAGTGNAVGAMTDVKTPYTEVIGEYTERATEAMERAYIPADAKEYVKDYFTGLAK